VLMQRSSIVVRDVIMAAFLKSMPLPDACPGSDRVRGLSFPESG
jgi:hypothetical protein